MYSTFFKKLLQYTSSASTGSQLCALGHLSCFREKGLLFKVFHAIRRCGNSLTLLWDIQVALEKMVHFSKYSMPSEDVGIV